MTKQYNSTTFDDISEKYSTWIIKYCSTTFRLPIFSVWYRDYDDASTDKILTYKNGNIFVIHSLDKIKNAVLSEIEDLIVCHNIISWLDNIGNIEMVESYTYDISELEIEIAKNNFDIKTLESFTNFINLYDVFVNQDLKYSRLQKPIENSLIKETWDYFYEFIFWPRFNDKEKFKILDRPKLVINSKDLLAELKVVINTFEGYIKINEKSIY